MGCKNDENRANLPNLDRGLVDGTMKAAIQKDRKRNKKTPQALQAFILIVSETMGSADYVPTQSLFLGQVPI